MQLPGAYVFKGSGWLVRQRKPCYVRHHAAGDRVAGS